MRREIVGEQPQLAVARRRVGETVEQSGEGSSLVLVLAADQRKRAALDRPVVWM